MTKQLTWTHLGHESAFRGTEVLGKRAKVQLLICGVGALGSWLVDILARQGFHNMTVLDRDRVEEKNFGTQNFGNPDVGKMKARQIRINTFRRIKIVVTDIGQELKPSNAKKLLTTTGPRLQKADLVVDAFDNAESRNLLAKTCRELSIPCLHSGMSADGFGEARWDSQAYVSKPPPEALDEQGEPCEYPLASNLVQATVLMTAEAVCRFVDTGGQQDFVFTLRDLNITRTK